MPHYLTEEVHIPYLFSMCNDMQSKMVFNPQANQLCATGTLLNQSICSILLTTLELAKFKSACQEREQGSLYKKMCRNKQ